MKKLILLPLLSLFVFSNLNAQNYFLNEGESNFTIQTSYSKNDNTTSFGFKPSLNLYGKTTISVDLRRFNSDNINGYKKTPYLSHLFLKKTFETSIVNLGLGAYYSFENDDDDKVSIGAYGVGPEFSYVFILENDFKIALRTGTYFGGINAEREYLDYFSDKLSKREFSQNLNNYGLSITTVYKSLFCEISYENLTRKDKESDLAVSISAFGISLGYMFK